LTPPQIEAVLFDFGETLFSRGDGGEAIAGAARERGVAVEHGRATELWEQIQAKGRTPKEMAKGRDLSPEAHRACWTALYSLADVLAAGIGEELYEREISPTGWTPVPDAEPTLRALKAAGVPVGVVSDAGWDIRPVFAHYGLLELIDAFVVSAEHGRVKPDPELFGIGCAALATPPAHTLMVGDNPLSDGGAVGAGLPVLLLPLAPPGVPRGLGQVVDLAIRRGA
jgi:FMN phosphatase YigB (HAD superfamily)